MIKRKILITGAGGQLGYQLTKALRSLYGTDSVIASDVVAPYGTLKGGKFEKLDVLQAAHFAEVVQTHNITQIYHLAAMLSIQGENNIQKTWKLNMGGLISVLEIAAKMKLDKVYWPSSIGAFGPSSNPKTNTPQHTLMDPTTAYGITKLTGEHWCEYYFNKYGLDVRSIRYPGLIGHKASPGNGVTDYAIEIYAKAVHDKIFCCPLSSDTHLPFLHIDDAIHATLALMECPSEKITIRSSYNIPSMSLSPADIASAIKKHIPDFRMEYNIDSRQEIAATWPRSIDGSSAVADWGWLPKINLQGMTAKMLKGNTAHKKPTLNATCSNG